MLTLTALALCALPWVSLADPLCSNHTNWAIPGSGSWFVNENWDGGKPDTTKSANIGYDGGNGGTATINDATGDACDLALGADMGEKGTVSMDHGVLNVSLEILVGGSGKGTLTATNGGSITANLLTIAAIDANSSGTVSIDGTNVSLTARCDVGGDNYNEGGVALLGVKNGGTVTVSAGYLRVYKSGTLTGNGALSASSGTSIEGTLSPSGTLTIGGGLQLNNGATMTTNVTQQAWGNVNVTGTATLLNGSKLVVTITGFFTGDFPLLHASTLNGQFSSVSINYSGCLAPSIVYDHDNGYVYLHIESTCQ